jgi:hypothetical protein
MPDIFNKKTPQEAIDAYNSESAEAFHRFAEANGIKSETDIEAFLITKQVFTAGYVAGAQLILAKVVESMKAAEKANIEKTATESSKNLKKEVEKDK